MLGYFIVLTGTGRISETSGLLEESKSLLEAAGDEEGLSIYYNLSGIQAAEELESSPDIYWSSYLLAKIAFDERAYGKARQYLSSAYAHIEKLGSNWGAGICLPLLGYIEILDGDIEQGVQVIGFAEAARGVLEMGPNPDDDNEQSHHLKIAMENLGEEGVQGALQAGRKLDFSQAFELASLLTSG